MATFDVKGMTCSHCVKAVTRAVQEIDAQARVEIDLSSGSVQVESSAPIAAIAQAITDAGYEAKPR